MHPTSHPPSSFHIVFNASSGHRDAEEEKTLVKRLLDEAGRAHRIHPINKGDDVAAIARRAVEAAMAEGGAVVAAGGDGTINAVAQAAYAADCPMGVLPQGTFNYFARTHRIPLELTDAVNCLLTSRPQPVQVGLVNGQLFLVNASLGLYPDLLEDREQFKSRYGRNRIVALFAALVTAFREHQRMRLRIEQGDDVRNVRSASLFVGNNRLQLTQVGLPEAQSVENGSIAAVMLKPVGPWALLQLLWHGAMGSLGDDERIESFRFRRMTVAPWLKGGRRRVKLATDGEVCLMRPPFEFEVGPKPLHLFKPVDGAVSTE